MREAKPWRLYSGKWGAWVKGKDVKSDMLICIRTRDGRSWNAKVKRVLRQRASGAICQRIDIVEEDFMDVDLPFLSRVYPQSELNHIAKRRILREQALDAITKVYRPAPAINDYEYYQDYRKDCAHYKAVLNRTIQEVSARLLEMDRSQCKKDDPKPGTSRLASVIRKNVRTSTLRKRAKIYSSQPILPASYLPRTKPPGPYSRLYGPDSVS